MYNNKKLDNTIENLAQEFENQPNDFKINFSLGLKYFERADWTNAIKYLEKAKDINPNNVNSYLLLSFAYSEKKDYDTAIKLIDNLPKNYKTWFLLGKIYNQKGEKNKAIEYLKKSVKLKSKNFIPYLILGQIYYERKEYDSAIEYLEKAHELNHKTFKTCLLLGQIYYEQKEYDKAIKYFNKAKEVDINNPFSYIAIGAVYTVMEKYNKAIKNLKWALKLDSNNFLPYLILGEIYNEKKEYIKAIEYLEEAINLNPKDSLSYDILSEIYYKKEKYDEAIKYLNESIKLCEKCVKRVLFLILIYAKKEDYDKAFEISLETPNTLINSFTKNLKTIFELEKKENIPIEYKKILFKVYILWEALKIKNIENFKEENNGYYLYQYKNFNSLENLLKDKSFHLIPTDYQNDPNEGKAFFDYINFKNIEKTNTDLVAFISCFSALEDNLIMWNSSYAQDGEGISIGIDINKISTGTKTLVAGISTIPSFLTEQDMEENKEQKVIPIDKIGLYKILYLNLEEEKSKDDDDKESKDLLREIQIAYKNIKEEDFYKYGSTKIKLKINNWLNDLFTLIRYLIKFDDYKHEKEYRLLYVCNIKNNQYVKTSTCWKGIHIETEKILFNNEKKKDIIFIGPKNNSIINKLKLEHYLKCTKLDKNIKVQTSKIKFR